MIEPVTIVSGFGRGLWLAQSLIADSIPVRWVDLTAQLGKRHPVDIEGPFPLMQSERLLLEQRQTWEKNGGTSLTRGIVFLTRRGPVELKGSFLSQRLAALGHLPQVIEYWDEVTKASRKNVLKNLFLKSNLSEAWMAQWGHRFWSLLDLPPVESLREGAPINLAGEGWIRSAQKGDLRLQSLQKNPLFFSYSDVEVEDISFKDRKTPSGLLLKKERSEFVPCSQLVWGLTSLETQYLSERISERVFKSQVKEVSQVWMRWEIQLELEAAPEFFVILDDEELPWNHNNLMIFIRLEKSVFSVWRLVPAVQRFNPTYLQNETNELLQFLKRRFPFLEVKIVAPPMELKSTTRELGPALHGLYQEGVFQRQIAARWNRFLQLGAETQEQQGPGGSFEREEQVVQIIKKIWNKDQEIFRKKQARMKDRD